MRILSIITKGEIGGAQMVILKLAEEQKKQGNFVVVGFGEGDFLEKELKEKHINIIRFKHLKRTNNFISNLRFIWEVKNYVKKSPFDIVHFHSSNALLGALGVKLASKKIKTTFTFHGLSYLDKNHRANKIKKTLYKFIFKFFLLFINEPIFVSVNNRNYAQKIGLTRRGIVQQNKISTQFFTRDESRLFFQQEIKTINNYSIIVGSIGRLAYPKNYEFIINNFKNVLEIIPTAICVFIGEGPERKKYETLIEKYSLEDKIFLLGNIEYAAKYLKGFDVFVLPSIYEGAPITILEAKSAGVPILATNVGEIPNLIGDKDRLFKLDDPNDFLENLRLLVKENNLMATSKY
jgi:glycosyltransferase involved in cell wall biosynthesis